MGGQQKNVALVQVNALKLAPVHDEHMRAALKLVKVFFIRVVMKIRALVRPADHGDDEIGIAPDFLVAYRGLQQVPVSSIQRG